MTHSGKRDRLGYNLNAALVKCHVEGKLKELIGSSERKNVVLLLKLIEVLQVNFNLWQN